jgi:hypothetical protein
MRGWVVRGAIAGGLLGTLTGLVVLTACGDLCDGSEARGMIAYAVGGSAVGAALGAAAFQLTR